MNEVISRFGAFGSLRGFFGFFFFFVLGFFGFGIKSCSVFPSRAWGFSSQLTTRSDMDSLSTLPSLKDVLERSMSSKSHKSLRNDKFMAQTFLNCLSRVLFLPS